MRGTGSRSCDIGVATPTDIGLVLVVFHNKDYTKMRLFKELAWDDGLALHASVIRELPYVETF